MVTILQTSKLRKVSTALGSKLKTCVPGERLSLDGTLIERRDVNDASTRYNKANEYRFRRVTTQESSRSEPEANQRENLGIQETQECF